MKRFIEGADCEQATLGLDQLDDYVDEDNPVRVIDAIVDALKLAKLDFYVVPDATGRLGYS